LLAKARDAMGFAHVTGRVLHARAITAVEQNYQSDRTYPPFFSNMSDDELWLDPETSVLRVQSHSIFPGSGPSPLSTTIDDGKNAELNRGEQAIPIPRRQATRRWLNGWAVIADWSAAHDVRVSDSENYRDYPRTV